MTSTKLLNANATTFLIRSSGSVCMAACDKNVGALDHRSTIRWIELRSSNILIGRDICEMDSPFSKLRASCLATLDKIPFYFSRASSSVQTRFPESCTSNPYKYKSFVVGKGAKMTWSLKYFGAGLFSSFYRFGSTNECGAYLTPVIM